MEGDSSLAVAVPDPVAQWIYDTLCAALPLPPVPIVPWSEKHVVCVGSARSEKFDVTITPWTREVLEACFDDLTRVVTFTKPVQCGGSTVGEIVLCRSIASGAGGDIQYNWEDNDKAGDRWLKRIEKILTSCGPVMARAPEDRHKWQRALVIFAHVNLTVQGAKESKNLDSDSIRVQINEEVHNWEPGRLDKAYRRSTAFWNSITLNISNAGYVGDQLTQAHEDGTQQRWMDLCPGCGKHHILQTRWLPKKPHLGGLRYDADGCRLGGGHYDYEKLESTVYYQMPCGHKVKDNLGVRRRMSMGGKYSDPRKGSNSTNRSYTLDGVSVYYIPWVDLIKEKHKALRALAIGNPKPFEGYIKERECRPYDPNDRPVVGRVILSTQYKKDRDRLPDAVVTFGAADFQRGNLEKGELEHWWAVIRDVDEGGNSLLVWEGKIETDEELASTMERHGVIPAMVVLDSGYNATHVYKVGLQYGYNCIKGGNSYDYAHPPDEPGEPASRKCYSTERPLHEMVNKPPTQDDPLDEPQYWLYSKAGIRDRLNWLRSNRQGVKHMVPGDVSEDYQQHNEAEELQDVPSKRGGTEQAYVQVKTRNDLYVCECYIAMMIDKAGLLPMEPKRHGK